MRPMLGRLMMASRFIKRPTSRTMMVLLLNPTGTTISLKTSTKLKDHPRLRLKPSIGANTLMMTRHAEWGGPCFCCLSFLRYFKERLPKNLQRHLRGMVGTSLAVNANFPGTRHRDQNNDGVSAVAMFHDGEGGRLMYWPSDDQKANIESLPLSAAVPMTRRP